LPVGTTSSSQLIVVDEPLIKTTFGIYAELVWASCNASPYTLLAVVGTFVKLAVKFADIKA
jgi:hypothetical protein